MPQSVDVVVIGGGIIGVSTALELAERGHSVLLCEKGQIGCEQSSRNWGWVRMSQRDPREMELMNVALRLWDGLEARTGHRTGFSRSGIIYTARSRKREEQLDRWMEDLRAFDPGQTVPAGLLRGADLEAVMPGFGGRVRSGFYTPADGRAEPQWASHAIACGAQAAGAKIVTGCAVRRLDISAGQVSGVITEKGRVTASAVVVAGGAWSRLFLNNEGVFLPQLKVLNSVMRVSGAVGLPQAAIWDRHFSFRPRADGGFTLSAGTENTFDLAPDLLRIGHRFLPAFLGSFSTVRLRFGNRWQQEVADARPWGPQDQSPFEKTRILDPEPSQAALRRSLAVARDVFPALQHSDVTQSWGGLIDVTPDELPVISDVPNLPGVFVSTGYSGHGFGIAPGAGKLTADLVTGGQPIVDPSAFDIRRFWRRAMLAAAGEAPLGEPT